MQLLRYILLPVVPLYYLVTLLRNKLYDLGVFSSKSFELPIICIGNLSTGGTGKSPMTEYLINLLKPRYRLAVLSRGYKRKSRGFILASKTTEVDDIGDEPYQIFRKFPDIQLAVDRDRVHGVETLLKLENPPEVILLDDGFQHRKLKAGLNIVLTSYTDLYIDDVVLPTGNLREPISGVKRADIVIVTKCPNTISNEEIVNIKKRLVRGYGQSFYFSSIEYGEKILNDVDSKSLSRLRNTPFTLVTGIANAQPMVEYLNKMGCTFNHMEFGDHHNFTDSQKQDIENHPLILTTEKDFVRLSNRITTKSVYYLPIWHIIKDADQFNKQILDYCNSYSIGAAEF